MQIAPSRGAIKASAETALLTLPSKGFVRLSQIIRPNGCIPVGRTRWYSGIKAHEFPPPRKVGNASLWAVSEIREVIRRIAAGELSQIDDAA